MNKVLVAIMLFGVLMAGFYGYQWWDGTKAAEKVPMEETEEWSKSDKEAVHSETDKNSSRITEVEAQNTHKNETPEPVTMSKDIDKFKKGENVGRVVIPSIEMGYTTFWGADPEVLKQGVGMYVSEWTTTPDEKRHTVLSGHRETVFTELGDVKKDDSIFVEYNGKRYEYKVEKMWVTDADDRSVIVEKDEATLTLSTCYPLDFIGDAPDRYIIQSKLINVNDMDK
ncbi:class D sortase [Halobacillus halophilus]|uniref:class D sortase n=1 Tax=Halobacillus halophilus TaxID=1570 RepID=UPI001CD7F8ED|nr:class D sortase [Halobacillus halophilus]MCA1009552.1 class D sortase [Halobacillus halophilus]